MTSSPPYHNDALPEYSNDPPTYKPSLAFYGLSLMKVEFTSPFHYNNGSRSWKPVLLELNSTQLVIHDLKLDKKLHNLILALYHSENYLEELMETILNKRFKDISFVDDLMSGDAYGGAAGATAVKANTIKTKFQKSKFSNSISKDLQEFYDVIKENKLLFEPTNSREEFLTFSKKYAAERLHVFTLQNSHFGEAPCLKNYTKENCSIENLPTLVKYSNVLRARLELKQILFQFWSFYGVVQWYRHFGIGKDLSSGIDDRKLSKLRTIPSRYARWNNEWLEIQEEMGLDVGVGGMSSSAFNSSGQGSGSGLDVKDSESVLSAQSSVFDRGRSSSVSSNSTTNSAYSNSSSLSLSRNTCVKSFDNLDIVSNENYYSALEKHYISNCIHSLNTFERWTGIGVTLSNYKKYLTSSQLKEMEVAAASVANKNKPVNLFISPAKLEDSNIWNFKKRQVIHKSGECKQFLIHQHGLVSLN